MTQPLHVQTGHPERKFGRLAPHPEHTHPRIHAGAVLADGFELVIPDTVDWYTGISFPMYLNSSVGDCTIADVGHAEEIFSNFGQGTAIAVTDNDVLTMYERVGGYVPGNPSTDNGCVIQDVLNDWRKNGIAGHQILAFLQVDYTNLAELKACCWLFGGVTLGVNFPQSAMAQFNAGQPWDYNPNANNTIIGGHDVRLVGFDANGNMKVVTWGAVQTMTPAWLAHFCEEAWSEADGEWIKNNTSPGGLDINALNAEFTKRTNQPGPFPVTPPPSPTPVPPTPPNPPPPNPAVVTAAEQAANNALSQAAITFIQSTHWMPQAKNLTKTLIAWLKVWGYIQ